MLGCGIVSSVLYVASDILISWWDPNYSYRDQSFSELLAPGSPTRPLLLVLNAIPYGVLVTAFGWVSGHRPVEDVPGASLELCWSDTRSSVRLGSVSLSAHA